MDFIYFCTLASGSWVGFESSLSYPRHLDPTNYLEIFDLVSGPFFLDLGQFSNNINSYEEPLFFLLQMAPVRFRVF